MTEVGRHLLTLRFVFCVDVCQHVACPLTRCLQNHISRVCARHGLLWGTLCASATVQKLFCMVGRTGARPGPPVSGIAVSGQNGVSAVKSSTCAFGGIQWFGLFFASGRLDSCPANLSTVVKPALVRLGVRVDKMTGGPSNPACWMKIFFTCIVNGRVMERFYWSEPHVVQKYVT